MLPSDIPNYDYKREKGTIYNRNPLYYQAKRFKANSSNLDDLLLETGNVDDAIKLLNEQSNDSFENLKYGSSITLNFVGENDIKLATKLRISDKVSYIQMPSDEYNINCLFRVLPSSQHTMQNKILSIIDNQADLDNLEIDYENFTSEIDSNTNAYNQIYGNSIRYDDTIQLYQDSSKRFLCFNSCRADEIKLAFSNKYSDSECFYLGLSEYPSDNTRFSFETIAAYQQVEDGYIKKHHFLYLT